MKCMKNKKSRGFTLIELIAVLVILAIIALIATPLVTSIIKKAKDSANKRSVDAYGKAAELAVTTYLLDNGDYPTDIGSLTIEYSGKEVVCNIQTLNEGGSIYLSECSVNGTEVKDSKNEDGYYHYGETSNVVGYQAYSIGDVVTYNGMNFYVIENSDSNSDSVTLLKEEPLTTDEVNTYGVGHVNLYTGDSIGTASDLNGYGGMAYYSSATCGYEGTIPLMTGCTTDYNQSDVKYVVDAWAAGNFNQADLVEARLIKEVEFGNLGYEFGNVSPSNMGWLITENTPSWIYSSDYAYWTMSAYNDSTTDIWNVDKAGTIFYHDKSLYSYGAVVRPVITLSKSAI